MRITAVLSPTCLRSLSVFGAVWSVLVVLCSAKRVENKPAEHGSDPPISQNNSEDFNDILCRFEDEAKLRGQDEHSADEPVVYDVHVSGAVDYEEEHKITSDKNNWNQGHLPRRQTHDQSLNRAQNSPCEDLQQSCEGKQYLECQRGDLYFEIQAAKDCLPNLKKAYALYARNTTWDIAAREVSFNVTALPPPVWNLTTAIEDAKRCGSFPVLGTNRENKANISEENFEFSNTENFVCLMSSMYEIVTVLTWLWDMVQLDLAMSPDTVLDNLVEISIHDSPTLSTRLSYIRGKTLSEMKCRNHKPNNDVLVKILQCELDDIGGPDHAVRGLLVIRLLDKYISILSQL